MVSEALCIKSNYAPTLYTDSLLFTQDVLYTQSPTLRDLGKGWKSPQDSKQEIVLFKYIDPVQFSTGIVIAGCQVHARLGINILHEIIK